MNTPESIPEPLAEDQQEVVEESVAPESEAVRMANLPPVLERSPKAIREGLALFVGYQFKTAIKVETEVGRIEYDTITHAQMLWLIANQPEFCRTNLARAYYPKGHHYWQGVDPETGQYAQE